MHLALVQPLYRAIKGRECTRISIDGTTPRCKGRRYWQARTALCAFCTEKGFTFLISSCPQLLDNIHLALVQPLYWAWKGSECTRISIDGSIQRCRRRRYWPARTDLCTFCTEKGFTFLTLHGRSFLIICAFHLCNLCIGLGRVANVREFSLTTLYDTARDVDIGRPEQLCAPFAPRKCLHL